jgi:hypothetical protein
MLVGYARVSTQEQDLAPQLDALHGAGCGRVFEEKASAYSAGASVIRQNSQFSRELTILRQGARHDGQWDVGLTDRGNVQASLAIGGRAGCKMIPASPMLTRASG